MNYSELCGYCRAGSVTQISRMLKKDESVDILWREGQLLQAASHCDKGEALNMLIGYYIAHIRRDAESDGYLSAMSKLIEA